MATFAMEQNGVAHQVWRSLASRDDIPPMHADFAACIHEAPDDVEEGWPWDGASFVSPPDPPPPMTEAEITAAMRVNDSTLDALTAAPVDSADTLKGKTVTEAIETIARKRGR